MKNHIDLHIGQRLRHRRWLQGMTQLQLAEAIWTKVHGDEKPFNYVSDEPFEHDVSRRVPSTAKAKQVLGFEATTTLSDMLDVVIPWIAEAIKDERI